MYICSYVCVDVSLCMCVYVRRAKYGGWWPIPETRGAKV